MAGANRLSWPRRGSLQFWPRVRAKRGYPRVRHWVNTGATKLSGFLGYKVGMTHVMFEEQTPQSLMKGQQVFTPVTVIECPPVKPVALRFYRQTVSGLALVAEVFSPNLDAKWFTKPAKEARAPDVFDEVRLVIAAQPGMTGIGKKVPDVLEVGISGKTKEERLAYGTALLGKDIRVGDVFKEHQYVDVHGVTKAKGFQGTVKRFGVKIRQHKSEKTKRGVGTLGSWTPKRVLYSVAQSGKMGYHTRTEWNKYILKVGSRADEVTPKGGFLGYGVLRNEYILLKGSVVGPRKRAVVLSEPVRKKRALQGEIKYVSVMSKQ